MNWQKLQKIYSTAVRDEKLVAESLNDIVDTPFSAAECLEVYWSSSFEIKINALIKTFSCCLDFLGDENFRVIARDYLYQLPEVPKNLDFLGAGLPEFVAAYEPVSDISYIYEMAVFDWVMHSFYQFADYKAQVSQYKGQREVVIEISGKDQLLFKCQEDAMTAIALNIDPDIDEDIEGFLLVRSDLESGLQILIQSE